MRKDLVLLTCATLGLGCLASEAKPVLAPLPAIPKDPIVEILAERPKRRRINPKTKMQRVYSRFSLSCGLVSAKQSLKGEVSTFRLKAYKQVLNYFDQALEAFENDPENAREAAERFYKAIDVFTGIAYEEDSRKVRRFHYFLRNEFDQKEAAEFERLKERAINGDYLLTPSAK